MVHFATLKRKHANFHTFNSVTLANLSSTFYYQNVQLWMIKVFATANYIQYNMLDLSSHVVLSFILFNLI